MKACIGHTVPISYLNTALCKGLTQASYGPPKCCIKKIPRNSNDDVGLGMLLLRFLKKSSMTRLISHNQISLSCNESH